MKLKKDGKIIELLECPYCGSDDEYYRKIYISGKSVWYDKFVKPQMDSKGNTDEAYNGEVYDHLACKTFKTIYCGECDKKLGIKIEVI